MNRFCLLLFCCLAWKVTSQNIKGAVYDENKLPVAGALVYMDGTSVGTLTDEKGLFEIVIADKIFTNLIVNYMGYVPVSVPNPFAKKFHIIQLEQTETQLNEVTIRQSKKRKKNKFKRAEKLQLFFEEFLGKTTAGKSCRILNESDIVLEYDLKKNRLIATSDVPVRIHNAFLGYDLEYQIKDCYIDFSRRTINSNAIKSWSFVGTTFFRDLTNDSTSYAAKRSMSYNASQMQFFRNLCRQTLNRTNFRLLHGSRRRNPADYFVVEDKGHQYEITVQNKKLRPHEAFELSFILEYSGKPDSQVAFYTKKFSVDKFGNNSSYNEIIFSGDISTKRIGDLLPLDYKSN